VAKALKVHDEVVSLHIPFDSILVATCDAKRELRENGVIRNVRDTINRPNTTNKCKKYAIFSLLKILLTCPKVDPHPTAWAAF
jgi:hypothetical protein